MANYFIADTHFGHNNVLTFDNRPFSTIEEHDETLIKNWNDIIMSKDTVYILGDFCWLTEKHWSDLLKRLKGKKFLIKGNHDLKQMTTETRKHFIDIRDYYEMKYEGKKVIMSHYPILCYRGDYNPNFYMLHGHTHNTAEQKLVEKWTKESIETTISRGQIINVGCMMPWMNYRPRTLKEIIERKDRYDRNL